MRLSFTHCPARPRSTDHFRETSQIKNAGKLRRAARRIAAVEARRQSNIEAIADRTLREIPESVSPEPVDPDWVSLFFEECKDVSAEELQALWARLLAREIAQPQTVSRRALGALKVMNTQEAHKFAILCGGAFETSDNCYQVLSQANSDALLAKQGLSQDDRLHFKDIGLTSGDLVISVEKRGPAIIDYFGKRYKLSSGRATTHPQSGYTRMILTETLTQLGVELMRVAEPQPNFDYIAALAAGLKGDDYDLVELPDNGDDTHNERSTAG